MKINSGRAQAEKSLYIGLMSGTSIDAIDTAIVECSTSQISLLASREHPISGSTRERIAALSQPGDNEIEQMGKLDRELAALFAEAALAILAETDTPATDIRAIGSHGQTIRHRPPSASHDATDSFSLQIGDPNTIAEITGITTVADFRRRDIAAFGQGAPLAPAFHAAAFAAANINRAIVNIGGIANVSLLAGEQLLAGFDTGPGNTLLDHWIQRHKQQQYDRDGAWARTGTPSPALLQELLAHPYLRLRGPRSTGKEEFNLAWLDSSLQSLPNLSAVDIQATLAEYTAATIAASLNNAEMEVAEVYICGGGAHNSDLMQRLEARLAPASLSSTATLGISPDWVEATAFAWLAYRTLSGLDGSAAAVTGARGPRILGGVFPGGDRF